MTRNTKEIEAILDLRPTHDHLQRKGIEISHFEDEPHLRSIMEREIQGNNDCQEAGCPFL